MYTLRSYYDGINKAQLSGAKVEIIGYSTLGRPIYMLSKGEDESHSVLIQAGMHAREYITTPLTLELMTRYKGNGRIYLIPSVNIDGMLLVNEGLSSVSDRARREFLLQTNNGSDDFRLWKANANAVDLNVNYPADWGCGKYNIRYPASANYIGSFPLSEVENRILTGITYKLQPKVTLSNHTKGNVIYTGYKDNLVHYDKAEIIANYINYDLLESKDSFGGYKDYFMATTPYLGLTVECGDDHLDHPLPMSELDGLIKVHDGIYDIASKLGKGIN